MRLEEHNQMLEDMVYHKIITELDMGLYSLKYFYRTYGLCAKSVQLLIEKHDIVPKYTLASAIRRYRASLSPKRRRMYTEIDGEQVCLGTSYADYYQKAYGRKLRREIT